MLKYVGKSFSLCYIFLCAKCEAKASSKRRYRGRECEKGKHTVHKPINFIHTQNGNETNSNAVVDDDDDDDWDSGGGGNWLYLMFFVH